MKQVKIDKRELKELQLACEQLTSQRDHAQKTVKVQRSK